MYVHACLFVSSHAWECECMLWLTLVFEKLSPYTLWVNWASPLLQAAHCSVLLDILAPNSPSLHHFCLCESHWSQSAGHYLQQAIIHIVTFAFSPVTLRSQGPGVTQTVWTTPRSLIYRVFQRKAPPRGLSTQAHRKASFTQSFIELPLQCVTV